MVSREDIRRSMERLSDSELLDIVEGRSLGYRWDAVQIAQGVLTDRGVEFEPVPASTLSRMSDRQYEARRKAEALARRRVIGLELMILGGLVSVFNSITFFINSVYGFLILAGLGVVGFGLSLRHDASQKLQALEEETSQDLDDMRSGTIK